MGLCNKFYFDTGIRYGRNYYDEIGRTGEVFAVQKDALFSFALRDFDEDALEAFFPNYSGSLINVGDGQGPMAASKGAEYLFAADDATNAPSVRLLNAVPLIDVNGQALRFTFRSELQVMVTLLALPSSVSNGKCAEIGLLANLGI